jgi:hypothetical protein
LRRRQRQNREKSDNEVSKPLDDAPGTRLHIEDVLADQGDCNSAPRHYSNQYSSGGM